MTEPLADPEILSTEECWRLLRTQSVGRFVANRADSSPYVVPVNFVVDSNQQLVIRTDRGLKIALVEQSLVAFEVDEIDMVHRAGWSVVVDGIARSMAPSGSDLEHEPWAPGPKELVLRITPTKITGRRLRLNTPETDERGYR